MFAVAQDAILFNNIVAGVITGLLILHFFNIRMARETFLVAHLGADVMAFCAVADTFKMRVKRREISRRDLSISSS
jgi:hypothetical protein